LISDGIRILCRKILISRVGRSLSVLNGFELGPVGEARLLNLGQFSVLLRLLLQIVSPCEGPTGILVDVDLLLNGAHNNVSLSDGIDSVLEHRLNTRVLQGRATGCSLTGSNLLRAIGHWLLHGMLLDVFQRSVL
jgi:hypothetical protein